MGALGLSGSTGPKGYTLDELLDKKYGPRGTRPREKFEVSTRILGWRMGLMFKDIVDVKKTIEWKSTRRRK